MRGFAMVFLFAAISSSGLAHAQRLQIGHVQEAPVYADQIVGDDAQARAESARSIFIYPMQDAWYRQHAAQFKISDAEAKVLEDQLVAYAKCSKSGYEVPKDPIWRMIHMNMIGGAAKIQKLLYQQFGGGRLLFQQAGVEAFDAMRRMLEQREADGDFAITDPEVRALAYDYWTRDYGAVFITDPVAIQRALSIERTVATCPDP